MSLSLTIDLTDNDLDHFQAALKRAQELAEGKSPEEITNAAKALVAGAQGTRAPDFIATRLAKLESMIRMVHDRGWGLGADDKTRVLTALSYFSDPSDVIPDSVPVVGYLDDAIMIELCVRELKHELEAYEDFDRYRTAEAARRGVDATTLDRADWLEEQRQELHQRMSRRRQRDFDSARGGSVFRVR